MGLKIFAGVADILFRLHKLTQRNPVHIAVVAPSRPNGFFDLLWKGIWSAAFELAHFGVRVDSYETDSHDLNAQKRAFANFRQKAPAAVAIAPAHANALDEEIARLVEREIPVITFHTDAPGSPRQSYVGGNPVQSGAMAGELLTAFMGGRGVVASFPGALETEHLKHRYLAFRNELKLRAPEIKESVLHAGYNGLGEAVRRVLHKQLPIDGIYVGCSRSHEVAKVLREEGRKLPFVGFDLTDATQPFLWDGTVSALIDEDVYHQGYLALHQAFEAVGSPAGERYHCAPLVASVMLASHCGEPDIAEPGSGPLEQLIRVRTQRVRRYQDLLERASSQLVEMSETDPLTGLANRAKFEEILAVRVKEHTKLAILMIGLNGFERTNSHVGQPVGDESLKAVAKVLKTLARPQDDCARIGGDEFCVLMPGADFAQLAVAKERILSALSKTVIGPGTLNLGIRVSAGSACLPEDASNAEDLLVRADNSLFAHKRASASALARDPKIPTSRGVDGGGGDGFDIRPIRLPIQ